jgi:hypothetical protein
VTTFVAVDWSGRVKGAERTIWMAVVNDGVLQRLENGRTRPEVTDELVALRGECDRLIVGLDFSFALPQWFMHEQGFDTGRALWRVAATTGEDWLQQEVAPFWRSKRPPASEVQPALRRTERDIARQCARSVPKSTFQIGGAGAVGTGSIRGMAELDRLANHGFAIWPFDDADQADAIALEVYPRLFTADVTKTRVRECMAFLDRYSQSELSDLHRGLAAATEDSFDAAVSALEMYRHRADLKRLPIGDATDRIEGRIWAPS